MAQVEGTSAPRTLVSGGPYHERFPTSWSPDGANVLFQSYFGKIGFEMWILPLAGNRVPYRFITTPENPVRSFTTGDPLGTLFARWKMACLFVDWERAIATLRGTVPQRRWKTADFHRWSPKSISGGMIKRRFYTVARKEAYCVPVVDRAANSRLVKVTPLFMNRILQTTYLASVRRRSAALDGHPPLKSRPHPWRWLLTGPRHWRNSCWSHQSANDLRLWWLHCYLLFRRLLRQRNHRRLHHRSNNGFTNAMLLK